MKVPNNIEPKPATKRRYVGAIKVTGTSFTLCFLVYVLVNWFVGRYPFGNVPLAMADEASQFVPFYADLWQVLHGNPNTSPLFSWNAGLGVPRIGDYTTYLGGPFPLLISLFPKKYLGLGFFIIKGIKLSVAGSAFSALLYMISSKEKNFHYQIFSLIYAFSGWTTEIAAVRIIWIDGLIALPLITIAGLWSLRYRRRALSIALICFSWWSNYYTAYMASLGAALLIIILSFNFGFKAKDQAKRILNFAVNGITGVSICSILLLPTYLAISRGSYYPGWPYETPSILKIIKSMYGGIRSYPDLPTIYVGCFLLFYIFAFFVNTKIKNSLKISAAILLAISVGSFFLRPVALVWNLFDVPNGSWFRFAFVVVFYLTLIGYYSFLKTEFVSLYKLVLGILIISTPGVWAYFTGRTIFSNSIKLTIVFYLSLFGAIVAVILFKTKKRNVVFDHIATTSAVASIVLMLLVNSAVLTAYFVDSFRGLQVLTSMPGKYNGVTKPLFVFSHSQIRYNNGLLYGVPEASYYSSIVPQEFGVDFSNWHGVNADAGGRMVSLLNDPYLRSISGAENGFDTVSGKSYVLKTQGLPFVTREIADGQSFEPNGKIDDVFARREKAVGASIYSASIPANTGNGPTTRLVTEKDFYAYKAGDSASFTCPKGEIPQVLIRYGGLLLQVDDRAPQSFMKGAILSGLSETLKFGVSEVYPGKNSGILKSKDFKCLNLKKLNQAIKSFDNVRAQVNGRFFSFYGEKDMVYRVRTPYSDNWECDAGTTKNLNQFLVISAKDDGKISCSYRIDGLRSGLIVSGTALLVALSLCIADRRFCGRNNSSKSR
ncbi:hypothetical protein HMPREF1862_01709 [Varibaculum cambriense]|uniref:YfhO family protein n=1 Tax=Varibaculum cambriense TaxID=184870 RepID=A0AB34WXM3_9ACTO|nr:YfhO family protein [Varibaculum cambriense]KXB79672.1 hypothetical protein HMPREF1862_01709 [Varibaculum cambriense]